MGSAVAPLAGHVSHPVHVRVEPALLDRNRLTVAFRIVLALPHLILVGGPMVAGWVISESTNDLTRADWTFTGGVFGAVAVVCAVIAWFAILFTGRYPNGLRALVTMYLRWRVRASAYSALLRDEYPPFGEGEYPARLELDPPPREYDRVSVAFHVILVIPQAIAIWALGIAWGITTILAWFAILFTGAYPAGLYRFGVNVLQWTTRVEAYLLLLHDKYPPFHFD